MSKPTAKVVKHSISPAGDEVITFSLEYGLLVHAEFLRHREQSHSVKSNRAIPMKVIRKEVLENPYVPVYFGKNKPGMVAGEPCGSWAAAIWRGFRYPACAVHWVIDKLGGHKEWGNRLLFPWQWVRETVTATSFDNFYNLRVHPDAQKDIKAIADAMYKAYLASVPEVINYGEWHCPYVETRRAFAGTKLRYFVEGVQVDAQTAVKCSAARVARSSYNNHDKSDCTLAADLRLYKQLVESKPVHASPVEAQVTPVLPTQWGSGCVVNDPKDPDTWQEGITHLRKDGKFGSGNSVGWVQARQTLQDHTCYNYKPEGGIRESN